MAKLDIVVTTPQAQEALDAINRLSAAEQRALKESLAGAKAVSQAHKEGKHDVEGMKLEWLEMAKAMGLVTSTVGLFELGVESVRHALELLAEDRKEALKGMQEQAAAAYTLSQGAGGDRGKQVQMAGMAEEFRAKTGQNEARSAAVAVKLSKGGLAGDLEDFIDLQKAMGPDGDIQPMIQEVINARTRHNVTPTRALLGKYFAVGPEVARAAGDAGLLGAGMGYSDDQRLAMAAAMGRAGHADDLPGMLRGMAHMGLAGKPIDQAVAEVQARAARIPERAQGQWWQETFGKAEAQQGFNALAMNLPTYQQKLADFQANRDLLGATQSNQTPAQQLTQLSQVAKARTEEAKTVKVGPGELARNTYFDIIEEHDRNVGHNAVGVAIDMRLAKLGMGFSSTPQEIRQLAVHELQTDATRMTPEVIASFQALIASIDRMTTKLDEHGTKLDDNSRVTDSNTAATATAPPAGRVAPGTTEPPGSP